MSTNGSDDVSTSPKAPQKYWWIVLVAVPITIAAISKLHGCSEAPAGTPAGIQVTTYGNASPASVAGGNVNIVSAPQSGGSMDALGTPGSR